MREAVPLRRGADYVVVDKPAGMKARSLEAFLRRSLPADAAVSLCQVQRDAGASGAVFAAIERRLGTEARALLEAELVVEVYTAILRGCMPLADTIRCQRRLCGPAEGERAWRLAGTRREGLEACTLARGLRHVVLPCGEPCTLAELRPLTRCPQQLRLHCAALGHPILGDTVHQHDRQLDWRYEGELQVPRLMLHRRQIRMPLARGSVEVNCQDPLEVWLQRHGGQADKVGDHELRLAEERVERLTRRVQPRDAWEASFAGGLSKDVLDDTHWDTALTGIRNLRGPPFGPAEHDARTAAHEAKRRRRAEHGER